MTSRSKRTPRTALALLCSAVVASSAVGCGTSGLDSLPLPAPGIGSGGYLITAVFANALNLPGHAKVKLSGADIGQMESMIARNYTAVTTLRIMDGVRIPVGSTAELRSATPLGDVFVAIKPPVPVDQSAPLLKGGDAIGLESTTSAATVESVLSSAALLVNGGAVQNFTNIVNGAGKATGDQGKAFGKLINQSNDLLAKLNARSGEIETALRETSRLADQLDSRSAALTDVLNAAGPATDTLVDNTSQIADLVEQLGATSRQLARFPSIAGTDDSGHSFIKDANILAGAWNGRGNRSQHQPGRPEPADGPVHQDDGRFGCLGARQRRPPGVGFDARRRVQGRPCLPRPEALRLGQDGRIDQVRAVAAARAGGGSRPGHRHGPGPVDGGRSADTADPGRG